MDGGGDFIDEAMADELVVRSGGNEKSGGRKLGKEGNEYDDGDQEKGDDRHIETDCRPVARSLRLIERRKGEKRRHWKSNET